MNKIATQMLDAARKFVEEHPDIVKATLLTGGLGALGGAIMTPSTDPNEPAEKRFGRRLKNALLGAAIVGGGTALIGSAGANLSSAKLMTQKTPEEVIKTAVPDFLTNPLTLGGAAGGGGLYGWIKDTEAKHLKARDVADAIGLTPSAWKGKKPSGLSWATSQLKSVLGDFSNLDAHKKLVDLAGPENYVKMLDEAGVEGTKMLQGYVDELTKQINKPGIATGVKEALEAQLDNATKGFEKLNPASKEAWTFLDDVLGKMKHFARRSPRTAVLATVPAAVLGGLGLAASSDD